MTQLSGLQTPLEVVINFNQLNLFKDQDKIAAIQDKLVTELHWTIFNWKYMAYLVETSGLSGLAPLFTNCLDLVGLTGQLCYSLGKDTNKYNKWSRDRWAAETPYEPYYSPVEPRSSGDLVFIAIDFKVRYKRLIMRIRETWKSKEENENIISQIETILKKDTFNIP